MSDKSISMDPQPHRKVKKDAVLILFIIVFGLYKYYLLYYAYIIHCTKNHAR